MAAAAQDILDLWFVPTRVACRFADAAAFDAQIRERFGETAQADGTPDDWTDTPAGRLC